MEINEELSKPYDEWWSNRTPEEYELQGLCFDCEEEYFEDMLLKDGSLLNDIIQIVSEVTDGIFLGIDKLRLYIVDNDDLMAASIAVRIKLKLTRNMPRIKALYCMNSYITMKISLKNNLSHSSGNCLY